MPVNIHVADPMWMYEPMDSTNHGLMNAYTWRIDLQAKGLRSHAELIVTLENIVRENPQTTLIACHLANCEYKLEILGDLFQKYKNLYADFSARYAETATIPRYMYQFFEKYQDRLVYGTDMGIGSDVYAKTFRILESRDEHFYEVERFGYHWPLYGFGLSDAVLKKMTARNQSVFSSDKGKGTSNRTRWKVAKFLSFRFQKHILLDADHTFQKSVLFGLMILLIFM